MDKSTSHKVSELCNKLVEKNGVTIMICEQYNFPEEYIKNFILDNDKENSEMLILLKEYLNDLAKSMTNNNASFCIVLENPIIILHPSRFNYWQDNEGEGYSDENFIEAVSLILKHEIGHYLHWKENPNEYNLLQNEQKEIINIPRNLGFIKLTEEIIREYFNSPSEQKANQYGEVDVDKLVYYSRIIANQGDLILINNALLWKNLFKNIDLIEKTIGKDYYKIANCIFKMRLMPIEKESDEKVLDYLLENYDYLYNLPLSVSD